MKHYYKTGQDLFGGNYVSFSFRFNGDTYGHSESFSDRADRFTKLRILAIIKQDLVEKITLLKRFESTKCALNKHKI